MMMIDDKLSEPPSDLAAAKRAYEKLTVSGALSLAEWVLVAQRLPQNARWILKNINEVLQHYGSGDVMISPRGSLKIGRVTMQRKGGDNGRPTANMLQFKIDPTQLFDI